MLRSIAVGTLTLAMLASAAPADADWLGNFMHSVARDTKRRNCWPKPFIASDRQAVRAPFAAMVSNGWRSQNMIGEHHFLENTGRLTDAGKLKIEWILQQAPEQHRTVYVFRGRTPEETAARVGSVRQVASAAVPDGSLPQILESSIPALGWPAADLDAIGRAFQSSIPPPRMPAPEETGS